METRKHVRSTFFKSNFAPKYGEILGICAFNKKKKEKKKKKHYFL